MTCLPFRHRLVATCLGLVLTLTQTQILPVQGEPGGTGSARMWEQLLADAAGLDLPTGFLKTIPSDFVRFEFDDLRTYAAEYHPGDHRLVLNRTLSFNAAGGTLKPLYKLTHKELEVLYHELFHAYMDFLSTTYEGASNAAASPLLVFARRQQGCRYGEVAITPVVQRRNETEVRYLTDAESWEALNETWAVFIGWAIWNQLAIEPKAVGAIYRQSRRAEQWIGRFEKAVQQGELRGYYVPEDPDERRVTQKRFLGGQSQISGDEAAVLMTQVLGFPEQFVKRIKLRPVLTPFFKTDRSCKEFPGQK
jgi:hypothetical protein